MTIPGTDQRSLGRRARDEQIAAEVQLPPLELPRDTPPSSVEAHLARRHRPLAIAGVVENGLVRPLIDVDQPARKWLANCAPG